MPAQIMKRLDYIDWMRGLACVLMFQTHCYDSWLTPEARKSGFFAWSQLLGTLPAPLFLFLAGVSFALVTERLRKKGADPSAIAKTTILRGAEIFALGVLFRMQEFALAFRVSPWTDLFRVDILNIIGLSMVLMGVLCWLTAVRRRASTAADGSTVTQSVAIGAARTRGILGSLFIATLVAMTTPLLWTTYRVRALPWPLESYLNGIHTYGTPQPWLFPLFPWSAFAFVGLAVGFFLFTNLAKRYEAPVFAALGGTGVLACFLSIKLDESRVRFYPVYDYWHTSPNFFLIRCGILLTILFAVYAWCRWGLAQMGFSPIIQLGKTSLLVYWVHIELVYGQLSFLPKHKCGILLASMGLAIVFVAMLALSLLRTNWKDRHAKAREPAPTATAAPA